jgi:hypothetical protein
MTRPQPRWIRSGKYARDRRTPDITLTARKRSQTPIGEVSKKPLFTENANITENVNIIERTSADGSACTSGWKRTCKKQRPRLSRWPFGMSMAPLRRLLCVGDAGLQRHHLEGTPDLERASVLRQVRVRGHRRAHTRRLRPPRNKGMWMGGCVPLRYDAKDRKLSLNKDEAENVRFIFRRHIELGFLYSLTAELEARGITSKRRISSTGKACGGCRSRLARSIRCCSIRGKSMMARTRPSSTPSYQRRLLP